MYFCSFVYSDTKGKIGPFLLNTSLIKRKREKELLKNSGEWKVLQKSLGKQSIKYLTPLNTAQAISIDDKKKVPKVRVTNYLSPTYIFQGK